MDVDAEFEQYVADSFARLCRTGFLLCGDWQRAEDAAQETLLKMHRSWGRIARYEGLDAYARQTLVRTLIEARDARALTRLNQRLEKADLLIVDELGFVPFDRAGGELLFNLLAERYERRSTLVTSNLAFGEWVQVFGDEKLTTALLDRLSHHAHILTTKGLSYRTRKRTVKN